MSEINNRTAEKNKRKNKKSESAASEKHHNGR